MLAEPFMKHPDTNLFLYIFFLIVDHNLEGTRVYCAPLGSATGTSKKVLFCVI